nr:MAG TPA: hypothetical protein [Caudoviricetes sp.]
MIFRKVKYRTFGNNDPASWQKTSPQKGAGK